MILVPDLSRRRLTPEQMDDPSLPAATHVDALDALARIHRVGGSLSLLRRPLQRWARATDRPLRVLDVATGGGDLLVDLAARGRRTPRGSTDGAGEGARPLFEFSGCDLSEVALEHARAAARRREVPVRFFRFDALSGAAPEGAPYDVVICSLFLHHLEDDEARAYLTRAASWSTRGLLVHDLVRSKTGWRLAWLASRLLTRSPVVRFDALRSVEGAFTAPEAREVAAAAGLAGATSSLHWPARFVMEWRP